MHIPLDKATEKLGSSSSPFVELFSHGTLSVELYQPHELDLQQPHEKDEVYIIVSGTGEFMNGNEKVTFAPGDFLFVPAGRAHRFINFTDDFATWVIFYGPSGGEKNNKP
ncbi:MAG TPA: cupin domain-containing protein [Niabella sp.]|jgi:mannose-6-phosphate isomerase-like protein (cupin superfamily)|nr:cupin domain-containing protein [Niabella sp.]